MQNYPYGTATENTVKAVLHKRQFTDNQVQTIFKKKENIPILIATYGGGIDRQLEKTCLLCDQMFLNEE